MTEEELNRFCALKHNSLQEKLDAQADKIVDLNRQIAELRKPIDEVTAGVRALRWLGMIIIAAGIIFKTGDLSAAFKYLTGAGQ